MRLTSSCATSLRVHLTPSGDWILDPANDLTASALRAGVLNLANDLRGGPKDLIAAAIMELIGATDRPPQLDEEKAAARILALRNMAWDYPIDVVQAACRKWRRVPQHGRWWPTEQDLRAQCEPLFNARRKLHAQAAELLRELEASEELERRSEQASPFASDEHRAFRNEMRKRLSNDRFEAYFNPAQMLYAPGEIHVRTQVADVILNREGRDLLERFGLVLTYRPEEFINVRLVYREETEKERVEVGQAMRNLADQLKGKPHGAH